MENIELNTMGTFPAKLFKYIYENKSQDYVTLWNHFDVNTRILTDAMVYLEEQAKLIHTPHRSIEGGGHSGYELTEKGLKLLEKKITN